MRQSIAVRSILPAIFLTLLIPAISFARVQSQTFQARPETVFVAMLRALQADTRVENLESDASNLIIKCRINTDGLTSRPSEQWSGFTIRAEVSPIATGKTLLLLDVQRVYSTPGSVLTPVPRTEGAEEMALAKMLFHRVKSHMKR